MRQFLRLILTALCCAVLASCAFREENRPHYSSSEVDRLQLPPTETATPGSPVENDISPRDLLRQRLSSSAPKTEQLIRSIPVNPAALTKLYAQNDFRPLWTNSRSIYQLFSVLEEIADDDLDAADYHYSTLVELNNLLGSLTSPPDNLVVDFDLLLSDSLTLLCRHLLLGKTGSAEFDDYSTVKTKESLANLSPEIISSAITQGTVTKLAADSRPGTATYARLRAALGRYRGIAAEGGWGELPPGRTLKKGEQGLRVPVLRKRLLATTDMVAGDPDNILFDDGVEAGVKHFQRRHSLTADGVVGPVTLAALNQPVEEKIHQIRINLERARRMAHLPEKYVLVDIAGFQVQFFNHGTSHLTARSQIGKTDRETPVFRSAITDLELNPTWTVPKTIFQQDILPEVKTDPDYLRKKGLRVMTWQGGAIDAANIDWSRYPRHEFPYALRQDPGPKNAMGRIKFMLPNPYGIYLHDTPNRTLFNADERTFSSGCVRIEQPLELAQLLLNDEKWSLDALQQTIDSQRKMRIHLKTAVPIIFTYTTVSVTEDGNVLFRKDIYQRDKKS